MRPRLVLALGFVLAFASGSAVEAIGGGASPLALSVSPARLALAAPASRTLELRNVGTEPVVVNAAPKSLDRRGAAKQWLTVRPARLIVPARSRAVVTLRAQANGLVRPGDHQLLLLLVARPLSRARVAVRIRLGVRMRIRTPGRIVRRLAVRGVRVRRHDATRDLLVSVANHGNIIEQLAGRLTVTLVRDRRLVSRLRLDGLREISPGTHAVVAMPYTGRFRGRLTAVVKVRLGGGLRPVERRYRIRL